MEGQKMIKVQRMQNVVGNFIVDPIPPPNEFLI